MTAPAPVQQHVLVTAVPRGYTADKAFLRVGVRLTIRLSYGATTSPVTLLDFPNFHAWPMGGLSWSASFDHGVTWEPAADELWRSDQGFWAATFPTSTRVDRKPVAPPVVNRNVSGYSYRRLAVEMQDYHTVDRFDASLLGSALLPRVFPDLAPSAAEASIPADLTKAVTDFVTFYRARTPSSAAPAPTSLDPDFHQRISLLSDHGPLLERLGLAFELLFPARPEQVTTLAVRPTVAGPPRPDPIEFREAYTKVRNVPGSTFAAATTSPRLDERLRLRLNDTALFDVHAIDVDASVIGAFSLRAPAPGRDLPLPPPPQSTGFTITQDQTHDVVKAAIEAGKLVRKSLNLRQPTDVSADTLIQGYLLETRRDAPGQVWRSLCHRAVTYTAFGDGTIAERTFVADSEAPVIAGLRLKEVEGSTVPPKDLETSDVLFRWDGWSLAAERPGRYQLQSDATTGDVVDSPGSFPGGTLHMETTLPADPAKRLPALRFGSKYQFRARAVDVTGFAHPWDGADALASPSKPYYRYDPVAAPLVLGGPLPTRTETSLRLVIRSDPRSGQAATEIARRTVVPARVSVEMGMTHGMFDQPGFHAPDPAKWSLIAEIDEKVPPRVWPPDDAPDSTVPSVVDWLPDPMSTFLGAALLPRTEPPGALKQVSFLPPGAEATGRTALGAWQSVVIELRGVKTGVPKFLPIVDGTGVRTLPVQVQAGKIATLELRGLPHPTRIAEHGLAQWVSLSSRTLKIYSEGYDQMCPPVLVTLVHAVRQPLTDPRVVDDGGDPGVVHAERVPGQKDPDIWAYVEFDGPTTGRLTAYASWSAPRDEGGFRRTSSRHRPPDTVEVKHNAIAERELSEPLEGRPLIEVPGRLIAPDLRRLDIDVEVVATSRFAEEFRQELTVPWSTVPGVPGKVLDLPAAVDVESVRLLRAGRDLVRDTDYRLIEDPRHERRTLALAAGADPDGIVVVGVSGTILARSAKQRVIVPAAMRPLPPDVAYVLPTFTGTTGTLNSVGRASATRGRPRVRIWLERPWWSSGVGEKLAVLWRMTPPPSDFDDDRVTRMVTLFGQDPLLVPVEDTFRMVEPTSGVAYPNELILHESIPLAPKVLARLHDVTYDAARDMYFTEVEWPEHRGGKFVRMAVARFQEHVVTESQLSLIRTIDPIRLLPQRSVEAFNISATKFRVKLTGRNEARPETAERQVLRVTVQKRAAAGDPELGWDEVESRTIPLGVTQTYPSLDLTRPPPGPSHRILIEECEVMISRDAAGGVIPFAHPTTPLSPDEAVADLTGLRPIWVATLPSPTNTP